MLHEFYDVKAPITRESIYFLILPVLGISPIAYLLKTTHGHNYDDRRDNEPHCPDTASDVESSPHCIMCFLLSICSVMYGLSRMYSSRISDPRRVSPHIALSDLCVRPSARPRARRQRQQQQQQRDAVLARRAARPTRRQLTRNE